jgi:type VI secretion system protein ImpL
MMVVAKASLFPYALALVVVLAIVIVILLVALLWKALSTEKIADADEPPEEPAEEKAPQAAAGSVSGDAVGLSSAFHRARETMNDVTDGNAYRTAVFLLVGAEGSRTPGFLRQVAGRELEYVTDDPVGEGLAFADGGGFLFFDDGVVVDVAGAPVLAAQGTGSDTKRWKSMLRHVAELRPKRPADGVIVTVHVSELEAARRDPASFALAARADQLHRRLWDLQRELGFRLPVYVLVTGCEEVEGFTDVCTALPVAARGQMLGWSNADGIQAPYRAERIDEAFAELHGQLGNLQMQLFANASCPAGVLQFPWSVRALHQPLRTFLGHLFRTSAHQESAIPRGFYFCGAFGGATAFVSELLEQKVFPEVGLALPTSRTRLAQTRKVRTLQIAAASLALIATAGLTYAYRSFQRENTELRRVFDQSEAALSRESRPDARVAEERAAAEILDSIGHLTFRRYWSVFVPSSWPIVTEFDSRMEDALGRTFSIVVLDAIRQRIDDRIEKALNDATTRIVPADSRIDPNAAWRQRIATASLSEDGRVLPIDQMPDFRVLSTFISEMRQAEMNGRRLNDIAMPGRGDLRALAGLAAYAFGQELSSKFFQRSYLYEATLRNASYTRRFDPSRYRDRADRTARELTSDFYRSLFDRNPFGLRVRQLVRELDPAALDAHGSRESEVERFRHITDTIHTVQTDLSGPELQWAFRPDFDLGASYAAIVAAMKQSALFQPETADTLKTAAESNWADFTMGLTTPTALNWPVLSVRDGRAEKRLSAETQGLQAALEGFLNQSFVSRANGQRRLVTTFAPATRVTWDPQLLQQSSATYQAFQRFNENGLKLFRPELQDAVVFAAQQRLGAQMNDLLVDAQTLDDATPPATNALLEQQLEADIERFTAAHQPLKENFEAFTRAHLYDERAALVAATTHEAQRLLAATDALLERQAPYTPRLGNFTWWDGKTPASPAAWDARDAADLTTYLDNTRLRTARLAQFYAKPLLSFFDETATGDLPDSVALVTKWQSIVDDLADYDAKKPGNAPAALEDYIGARMAKVTLADCSAASLTARPQRASGYFAGRLVDLSRQLSARCSAQAAHEARELYADLARFYDQRLAGRYPFAAEPPRQPGQPEADPEDVRNFYRRFGAADALFNSIPGDSASAASLADARHFLKQMRDVRGFFASFLDAPKPMRVPAYDLETEFRTLQQRELGGNEIIRWSLSVADETVTDREKAQKIRWTPGQPVRVAIRWANDAPHVPVLRENRRGMTVDGRTVTYEYANRWALLAALADLRAHAEDLGPINDPPPVTLSLTIDTKPADEKPDQKNSATTEPAQLFMRVALLTPEGAPLEVPDFPKVPAPVLPVVIAEDLP